MKIITCVYWEGDFRKRNYTPGWALRIKSMAERQMKSDFDFAVLTNVPHKFPAYVKTIRLVEELPGWWSKLEAFMPGVFEDGERILLLDLDLLIMKDLTPLFDYDGEFCLADTVGPFNRLVKPGMHSAGVMVFDGGSDLTAAIWREFEGTKEDSMQRYRGDGRFLDRFTMHFTRFPEGWVTKLRYCPKNGNLPAKNANIIHCMPWKNDIAAEKFKWVKEAWQ